MTCPIIRAATILDMTWEPGSAWPEKAKECQAILVEGEEGLDPTEAALATLAGRRLVISRIKREIARLEG